MQNQEKQIEEMARTMISSDNQEVADTLSLFFVRLAEALYNAGYRKQKDGEWIWDREHSNYKCSLCGEYDIGVSKFCRECGAKMKGGAE